MGGLRDPPLSSEARESLSQNKTGSAALGVTSEMASDEQLQTHRVLSTRLLTSLPASITSRTQTHILDALKLAVVRMQAAAATGGTTLNFHRGTPKVITVRISP